MPKLLFLSRMTLICNLPEQWDAETDLVAIGSGGGGLAAAITAREHGLDAMVLERTDQVGGVTAFSMGEVWVPGNHHEAALGIERSLDGYRHPVVVAMQRLALMAAEGDEVRRGEHQVILADGHAIAAAHELPRGEGR